MKTRLALIISVLVIASMLLTACPAPTPQVVVQTVEVEKKVVETVEVVKEVVVTQEVAKVVEAPAATPFVTWFQFDQGNVDPKSDERVGNEYLRKVIPQFNQAFKGKWVWDNQFTPWDRARPRSLPPYRPMPKCPI